jgi:hypothetical protein
MVTLTVEELMNYCMCPTLYQKKFVELERPLKAKDTAGFDGHSHIIIKAQNVIDDIVGYYFHRLMDDRQVRYQTLYKRWQNKWWDGFTGKDIAEYIVPVSRANMVRMNTNFVQHLPIFYRTFHKPFKPLAVERELLFPVNNLAVESKIQMAFRTRRGVIRIVRFIPYRISPGPPERDIELLTQGCSWLFHNDEDEVEIAYYCMLSPDIFDPFTVNTIRRDKIDSLVRVVKAFENNEPVTQVDCAGCEYKCNK